MTENGSGCRMKRQYGLWMLGVWLAAAAAVSAAPVVSNIRAEQRAGTRLVDIWYDLADSSSSSLTVTLEISNNGNTSLPANTLEWGTGHTAAGKATPGVDLLVTWDAGTDWDGNLSDAVRFAITAEDNSHPGPPSDMVRIPGGTNSGTDPDFGAYSLTVDTFWMDATEVTKAQWDAVYTWAIANGYSFDNSGSGKGNNHPVHTISWYDAVKWCNARSERAGRPPAYTVSGNVYRTGQSTPVCNFNGGGYRLSTITEWEYAARGGHSSRRFPWGDTISHANANYIGHASGYSYDSSIDYHPSYNDGVEPYTAPVKSFAANGYGLYDMAGNVWEWCWNSSGSYGSVRGGSWNFIAHYLRCGDGYRHYASYASNCYGFRAACRSGTSSHSLTSGVARVDTRAKNPVVFLHGYKGSPDIWNNIITLLVYDTNAFYPTNKLLILDYRASTPDVSIPGLAGNVATKIKAFSEQHGGPVDVVAHSMGGLLLRSALAQGEGVLPPGYIRRFIPIATPHYGQYFGVDTQSKEMTYGSEFLWNLAKAWHLDGKKIPDENVLCIVGRGLGLVNNHWDGLVQAWSAALGNTEARYVHRGHAFTHSIAGTQIIYTCWGRDNEQALPAAIKDGSADDYKDPVYALIRDFLMTGTKIPQDSLYNNYDGGISVTSLNGMGGSIFFQVADEGGAPVRYSGNILKATEPSIGDTSVLSLWHGDGGENTYQKGIELVTKTMGDIGIPARTYTLQLRSSQYGRYLLANVPNVNVLPGRTTVLPLIAKRQNMALSEMSVWESWLGVMDRLLYIFADGSWTAVASDSWVTLHTIFGIGSGPLRYSIAPNPTTQERTTAIVIATTQDNPSGMSMKAASTYSLTVTVTQAAASIGVDVPPGMVRIPGGVNEGILPDGDDYIVSAKSFWMDATEVTKAKWDEVYTWAIANGYSFDNAGNGKAANHPVHSINWFDCVKWCNARSEKEGRSPVYTVAGAVYRTGRSIPACDTTSTGYRLPSFTEWRYAARGGLQDKRFPWGNETSHSNANYNGSLGLEYDLSEDFHPAYNDGVEPYTSPVGSFAPNGYGLYDIVGNVFEWSWDQYGSYRFIHGGSWHEPANLMNCNMMVWVDPSSGGSNFGFRTACSEAAPVITAMQMQENTNLSLSWPKTASKVRVWRRDSMMTGTWDYVTGWIDETNVVLDTSGADMGFFLIEQEP